jgi:signal transduction histidine kinase
LATKKPPVRDDDAVAKAARDLARSRQQVTEARAQLARLRQQVAEAESRLSEIAATHVTEAREQRVFTTVRAQADADACGVVLDDASRSAGLDPLTTPDRALLLHRFAQVIAHGRRANERANADPELREVNERLLLAALNAQELQAVAEQSQQRQADSMAFVVHELRNPLTPIRLASEMLGMVSADQIPRYQAIIENEVEHLSRLVSDLIDVSRARTGKLRLERREVDMASLVAEVVESCRPPMNVRLQHLGVQVPRHVPNLFGDPIRLAQVLRNLLDNASKYTPNGGEIELSVGVSADAIEMTVSDNGIGITAEGLPLVFEPFVQDIPAVSFNGLGLGIGLTVVRELVEAHGGTVTAASAGSGCGSRFVVTLPLGTGKPGA